MGTAFLYGQNGGAGGSNLILQVQAFASALLMPETADENTIAVITEAPITSAFYGVDFPDEPSQDSIFVNTNHLARGIQSVVIHTDPTIEIRLNSVYQFVSGSWQRREAYVFTNGAWVPVNDAVFYKDGFEYEQETGGITVTGTESRTKKNAAWITLYTSRHASSSSTVYRNADMRVNNEIDLSNIKTLHANILVHSYFQGNAQVGIYVGSTIGASDIASLIVTPAQGILSTTTRKTISLDVSNILSGYVTVFAYCSNSVSGSTDNMATINVYEFWGERL